MSTGLPSVLNPEKMTYVTTQSEKYPCAAASHTPGPLASSARPRSRHLPTSTSSFASVSSRSPSCLSRSASFCSSALTSGHALLRRAHRREVVAGVAAAPLWTPGLARATSAVCAVAGSSESCLSRAASLCSSALTFAAASDSASARAPPPAPRAAASASASTFAFAAASASASAVRLRRRLDRGLRLRCRLGLGLRLRRCLGLGLRLRRRRLGGLRGRRRVGELPVQIGELLLERFDLLVGLGRGGQRAAAAFSTAIWGEPARRAALFALMSREMSQTVRPRTLTAKTARPTRRGPSGSAPIRALIVSLLVRAARHPSAPPRERPAAPGTVEASAQRLRSGAVMTDV